MKKKVEVEDFGAPKEFGYHHFRVEIPASPTAPTVIVEDFGLSGGENGVPYEESRVEVPRQSWTLIADVVRKDFNSRLKAHKLPAGRWHVGIVKVERLLGKELCVLAWSCEQAASTSQVQIAIDKWQALRPEERWWLFTMTAAESGRAEDSLGGWRQALRLALGSSMQEPVRRSPRRRPQREEMQIYLPFFKE